jgi:hypothetical protein
VRDALLPSHHATVACASARAPPSDLGANEVRVLTQKPSCAITVLHMEKLGESKRNRALTVMRRGAGSASWLTHSILLTVVVGYIGLSALHGTPMRTSNWGLGLLALGALGAPWTLPLLMSNEVTLIPACSSLPPWAARGSISRFMLRPSDTGAGVSTCAVE